MKNNINKIFKIWVSVLITTIMIVSGVSYATISPKLDDHNDETTEIELLLTIIENEILMAVDINEKVLGRLEQIIYSAAHLDDFSIPNRAKVLFNSVLNQGKHYTAFRLALITGNLFRIAKDVYRGGKFMEECAQSFYSLNKVNYARYMYQKALESYLYADKRKELRNIAQKTASL